VKKTVTDRIARLDEQKNQTRTAVTRERREKDERKTRRSIPFKSIVYRLDNQKNRSDEREKKYIVQDRISFKTRRRKRKTRRPSVRQFLVNRQSSRKKLPRNLSLKKRSSSVNRQSSRERKNLRESLPKPSNKRRGSCSSSI
jgi:hypothetical protein